MAGTSGSEVKLCQPASSQSKIAQTRSLSFGSRKTCAPLQPCCFRFSAPLVEKVFQKRSKSAIFAVARTIFAPLSECVGVPSTLRHLTDSFASTDFEQATACPAQDDLVLRE